VISPEIENRLAALADQTSDGTVLWFSNLVSLLGAAYYWEVLGNLRILSISFNLPFVAGKNGQNTFFTLGNKRPSMTWYRSHVAMPNFYVSNDN